MNLRKMHLKFNKRYLDLTNRYQEKLVIFYKQKIFPTFASLLLRSCRSMEPSSPLLCIEHDQSQCNTIIESRRKRRHVFEVFYFFVWSAEFDSFDRILPIFSNDE